ncbi:hypothetical protein [Pseudosulfitobacter pseudonitzschiae]|uniref:hypothetical protein n=1 Tax=Pseudosulfitobacter pseudonitzschiae TaxID=1402135 RepID=UPI001AF43185|nr:hypothetical protein [Pseudosulfitobacter pseudonitzschiae]MBM1818053.1 hypothetical protein [Pseudosulfitobacter pseudonitzschiae]MBM1835080.1 hypothetical protein [Pseudosulfitobacter pseudonitzschiae]MBM1839912.1 hypothetical protein [Pseudosulfitobacter pseudonitzschiae]MBM1844795.1 hypothetical protein [Pseudosulfitobacter pseudonitzschiae]MBM1849598.1 hypothetical protein [Pseudosulfitobacter pseudonitzschiae]
MTVRARVHELLTASWEAGGKHDFSKTPDDLAFDLVTGPLDVDEYQGASLEVVANAVAEWRADR